MSFAGSLNGLLLQPCVAGSGSSDQKSSVPEEVFLSSDVGATHFRLIPKLSESVLSQSSTSQLPETPSSPRVSSTNTIHIPVLLSSGNTIFITADALSIASHTVSGLLNPVLERCKLLKLLNPLESNYLGEFSFSYVRLSPSTDPEFPVHFTTTHIRSSHTIEDVLEVLQSSFPLDLEIPLSARQNSRQHLPTFLAFAPREFPISIWSESSIISTLIPTFARTDELTEILKKNDCLSDAVPFKIYASVLKDGTVQRSKLLKYHRPTLIADYWRRHAIAAWFEIQTFPVTGLFRVYDETKSSCLTIPLTMASNARHVRRQISLKSVVGGRGKPFGWRTIGLFLHQYLMPTRPLNPFENVFELSSSIEDHPDTYFFWKFIQTAPDADESSDDDSDVHFNFSHAEVEESNPSGSSTPLPNRTPPDSSFFTCIFPASHAILSSEAETESPKWIKIRKTASRSTLLNRSGSFLGRRNNSQLQIFLLTIHLPDDTTQLLRLPESCSVQHLKETIAKTHPQFPPHRINVYLRIPSLPEMPLSDEQAAIYPTLSSSWPAEVLSAGGDDRYAVLFRSKPITKRKPLFSALALYPFNPLTYPWLLKNQSHVKTRFLPFKPNQVVRVFKISATSDWWFGRLRGSRGYFPRQFVAVQGRPAAVALPVRPSFDWASLSSSYKQLGTWTAITVHAFHDDQPDLNVLSFEVGEIVNIIQATHPDWWFGECRGLLGFFPASFVNLIDASPVSNLRILRRRAKTYITNRTLLSTIYGVPIPTSASSNSRPEDSPPPNAVIVASSSADPPTTPPPSQEVTSPAVETNAIVTPPISQVLASEASPIQQDPAANDVASPTVEVLAIQNSISDQSNPPSDQSNPPSDQSNPPSDGLTLTPSVCSSSDSSHLTSPASDLPAPTEDSLIREDSVRSRRFIFETVSPSSSVLPATSESVPTTSLSGDVRSKKAMFESVPESQPKPVASRTADLTGLERSDSKGAVQLKKSLFESPILSRSDSTAHLDSKAELAEFRGTVSSHKSLFESAMQSTTKSTESTDSLSIQSTSTSNEIEKD